MAEQLLCQVACRWCREINHHAQMRTVAGLEKCEVSAVSCRGPGPPLLAFAKDRKVDGCGFMRPIYEENGE